MKMGVGTLGWPQGTFAKVYHPRKTLRQRIKHRIPLEPSSRENNKPLPHEMRRRKERSKEGKMVNGRYFCLNFRRPKRTYENEWVVSSLARQSDASLRHMRHRPPASLPPRQGGGVRRDRKLWMSSDTAFMLAQLAERIIRCCSNSLTCRGSFTLLWYTKVGI